MRREDEEEGGGRWREEEGGCGRSTLTICPCQAPSNRVAVATYTPPKTFVLQDDSQSVPSICMLHVLLDEWARREIETMMTGEAPA